MNVAIRENNLWDGKFSDVPSPLLAWRRNQSDELFPALFALSVAALLHCEVNVVKLLMLSHFIFLSNMEARVGLLAFFLRWNCWEIPHQMLLLTDKVVMKSTGITADVQSRSKNKHIYIKVMHICI